MGGTYLRTVSRGNMGHCGGMEASQSGPNIYNFVNLDCYYKSIKTEVSVGLPDCHAYALLPEGSRS